MTWHMAPSELFQPRLVRDDGIAGANVLVVDDIDANLLALEAVLSPLRCRLVYARSGSEALAHLLREEFALILMDVQMPDMDGYETARLVRARRKTQHVPIIFLTAHDYDATGIKRAYDLGAVDFLPKPLDVDVLRAKAQAFIALYERTLEVAELRAERAIHEERARQEAEALRRDVHRLAEADRRKTELLAAVAQELRGPLGPIRSALDIARSSEHAVPMLDVADTHLHHVERIVSDLFDVTRISVGALSLHTQNVDLAIIIDRAAAEVGPALDSRELDLVLEGPAEPVAVDADVEQMVRVIARLLGNAARHTAPGGTITVRWGCEYGNAVVRVIDRGAGIPSAQLQTLFEMNATGLAFGLAVAKQLVDLHRGTLTATSEGEGRGSTFELRLPASEFPIVAARNRLATMRQRALTKARSLRVLLVDHDEDSSAIVARLLTGRGHRVTTAHDARSALAVLADQRPDFAIVALDLPRVSGGELLRLAQTIEPPLATRFVAIVDGTDRQLQRARDFGFSNHVAKPILTSTIALMIEAE